MTDAIINLRVPAEMKARWVRMSRASGKRLTDWITDQIESRMRYAAANLEPEHDDDMFAPIIYNVENGLLGTVHKSWQRPDGRSASGNLARDRMECAAEMWRLTSQR